MLFVTNRILQQSPTSRANRRISFRLGAGGYDTQVFFCERTGVGEYVELMSKNMLARIRDSERQEIVLFVHGYNVLPEGNDEDGTSGGFWQAGELQSLLDIAAPGRFLVITLLWPTDNDPGMVKDYFDDRMTADASGSPFARALAKFLLWRDEQNDENPCFKRINVVAHSMGAALILQTLLKWKSVQASVPRTFRNIFLFAADVTNDVLHRDDPGVVLSDGAGTVTVYYAADDLAMRASKVANIDRAASRRMGHTGPEDMDRTSANVHAFDCGDFNTEYDPGTGHTYLFRNREGEPGAAFRHMAHTLMKRLPDTSEPIEELRDSRRTYILPASYKGTLFA